MRLIYAAVILALLLPGGCSKPVDAQRAATESSPSAVQAITEATPATVNVQLVSLNLPGMT